NGAVNVYGAGATDLYVDDDADDTGRTATLNDGSITGLAPATISWTPSSSFTGGVTSLHVHGGSGGNTFTVANTSNFYFWTWLGSGSGDDTVNVGATTGDLYVYNDGGYDYVYVGSNGSALGGTAQNVHGLVDAYGG